MKNIFLTLFCVVAFCFASMAQNIFIKPFGGSAYGFSTINKKQDVENFEAYNLNKPKYWNFNAYYGLSLEWQKDTKNRFELSFATQELGLGYQIDYTSTVTGTTSSFREYTRKPTLNIAFNYGRTLGTIGLKTGKKFSFDGIIGASFIKKSSFGMTGSQQNIGNIRDLHTVERDWNTEYPSSFGINLGFATRLHNAKGNAVLEFRLQYIKSFAEMRYRNLNYKINGQEFEFKHSTHASMINFAFGIPIRVLSTKKDE
jgi:hypothetical protein